MTRCHVLALPLLFALSLGCSAAPVAGKAPAAAPAKTQNKAASADASPPWRTNLLSTQGITIEMPGAADFDNSFREEGGKKFFYNGLTVTPPGSRTRYDAGVFSISTEKEFLPAEEALERLRDSLGSITREQKIKLGSYEGVEIEGKAEQGQAVSLRAYTISSYLYVLRVEATARPIDEGSASRFFDSFQLETPFRPFVSQYDYFTVAMPDSGLFKYFTENVRYAPGAVMKTFMFTDGSGGGYTVMVLPTAAPTTSRDASDELAEKVVMNIIKEENGVIELIKSVDVDGAPGRDVTYSSESDDGSLKRMLIAVKNDRVYMAVRFSQERSKLTDQDASKFFASLTIGRAP